MSTQYFFGYQTGKSLYFILSDPSTGNVWNGAAFVAVNLGNWTQYAQAMAETPGMGRYTIQFPTAIATRGRYSFSIRKAVNSPLPKDIEVGGGDLGWTGTNITSLESLDIFPGFDLTRTLQKIAASAAGPVSGAGSGHVVFADPNNTITEFECDTDDHGNRSNLNYHQ